MSYENLLYKILVIFKSNVYNVCGELNVKIALINTQQS